MSLAYTQILLCKLVLREKTLDTLSLFVDVLGFVICLAKALVLAMLIFCFGHVLKLLPKRIRDFISAFAGTVLIFALLRELAAQNVVFFTFKLSLMLYVFYSVCCVTTVICVAISSYIEGSFLRIDVSLREAVHTYCMRSNARHKANESNFLVSSSYILTSPVILQ